MRGRSALAALVLVGACQSSGAPVTVPTTPATTEPTPSAPYAVRVYGDPGLPEHTVYAPTVTGRRLPVIAWGNGGCRTTNGEHRAFLRDLASRGYVIVALGAVGRSFDPQRAEAQTQRPQALLAGIDWALAQGSPVTDLVDPARVVMMGQSCGASEALTASSDPRVRATLAFDNGGDVGGLHAPVLFFSGGPDDETVDSTTAAYDAATVPKIHVDEPAAGHIGPWHDPALQRTTVDLAVQWLHLALDDDAAARTFLLGAHCGLCDRPGWSVDSQGW